MATLGKKKLKEIFRINLVHEVLESELKDDADFLENAPDMWENNEKQLYDLMNTLSDRTLNEVEKILNRKK